MINELYINPYMMIQLRDLMMNCKGIYGARFERILADWSNRDRWLAAKRRIPG